ERRLPVRHAARRGGRGADELHRRRARQHAVVDRHAGRDRRRRGRLVVARRGQGAVVDVVAVVPVPADVVPVVRVVAGECTGGAVVPDANPGAGAEPCDGRSVAAGPGTVVPPVVSLPHDATTSASPIAPATPATRAGRAVLIGPTLPVA